MIKQSAQPVQPIVLTHKIDAVSYGATIVAARENFRKQQAGIMSRPTTPANETRPKVY